MRLYPGTPREMKILMIWIVTVRSKVRQQATFLENAEAGRGPAGHSSTKLHVLQPYPSCQHQAEEDPPHSFRLFQTWTFWLRAKLKLESEFCPWFKRRLHTLDYFCSRPVCKQEACLCSQKGFCAVRKRSAKFTELIRNRWFWCSIRLALIPQIESKWTVFGLIRLALTPQIESK